MRHSQGVAIRIRVGLNSGEVVVRAIGSDLHMDYSAVGQTTHLAGRMEQLADPGAILLTSETLRLAEGYVEVKPLGPVPVKGLAGAQDVYELVGAGAVRSRLHAAAARGLSRFVGRDTELAQLRQAPERTGAGYGQLVAVVGEPGWASPASTGNSFTPTAPRTGSPSRPARSPTVRLPPTCPSSIY